MGVPHTNGGNMTTPGTRDYDLDFDDDYDEDAGETDEQGRRVEHLPPPPEMGGMSGYSDIHGEHAAMIGGRSTSPKLFVQAAGHPTVSQLRIWKMENGVPVGLGAIDAEASEEDMVRQFYSAMPRMGEGRAVYKIRPIDVDGREMGTEATVIISEHHTALQQQRKVTAMNSGNNGSNGQTIVMPQSGLPSEILGLMQRSIDSTRDSLDSERERGRELMHQMAQERIDLAGNATASVQAMSERMLDAESKRNDTALQSAHQLHQQTSDNTAAFFRSQLEVMRGDRERESERAERERDMERDRFQQQMMEAERRKEREREESDRRRQQDREDWERRMMEMRREDERREKEREQAIRREKEAAERRWKMEQSERREEGARRREEEDRKERERQREHEMKLRQTDLDATQQREHAERMMQLQQAQIAATMAQAAAKGSGDIKKTLKEVTGTLAMLGLEPGDVMGRLFGGGGEAPAGGAAWAELAGKVMGTVGEVAKAKMVADVEKGRPRLRMAPPPRRIQEMPPGAVRPQRVMVGPDGQPMGVMGNPGGMPPGFDPSDMDDDDDWDEEDMEEMDVTDQGAPIHREMIPQGAPPTPPSMPTPQRDLPPIGLPLSTQRLARKAIRGLIPKLKGKDESEWESEIAFALTSEPTVYHYVNAVTVPAALAEGGAEPELSQRIISALQQSEMVPDDLNYGER